MDNTRAQQKALDDELVAPADRLKIGKRNLQLSPILKSKEPTLQVALDALKLTPFYNAFKISADVPEIYMQEFWVTVSRHHSSLRFKLNGKSHTVNVDNFRDMLKICPKLPDGVILPQHLTNQAMLESKAYMTYRAYATGEKIPKPKTTKKKADSDSSPKTKSTQASKGKRVTTLAKGDKPAKKKQSASKSKGLTVLSEVALTEAQQMKIAIERSKIQTHSSNASGSSEGIEIQSKVLDEQQQNISGTNEGAGDKLEVLDVPEYRSESEEESWTYSQGKDDEDNDEHDSENNNDDEDDDQENVSGETESDNDGDDFVHPNLSTYKADDQEEEKEKANDDEDVSSDQMVSTPPDYEITEEEENQEDDDDVMGGEQADEENEELYGDLNLNLDRRDAEKTDAQNNQETEEVYVTLNTEPSVVQQQSSSVSSDLVSYIINPSPDTSIDSILNPNVQSDIPVNNELSELKQTNQFAEALSCISGIVDNYLASKMEDAVNVAVQLKSNKLREEAQAENDEFLKQIDSNIKTIIKD
ncbi:hypothetical protein Tco_1378252 [Tanacetum coccineum]